MDGVYEISRLVLYVICFVYCAEGAEWLCKKIEARTSHTVKVPVLLFLLFYLPIGIVISEIPDAAALAGAVFAIGIFVGTRLHRHKEGK